MVLKTKQEADCNMQASLSAATIAKNNNQGLFMSH